MVDERDRPVPRYGGRAGGPAVLPEHVHDRVSQPAGSGDAGLAEPVRHTGDLGYIDEDGFVFFIGRQAHWLRRRGENISCYEVEHCIDRVPGVAEVAVVGVPDLEVGEEDVKAFVVADAAVEVAPAAIHAYCRENLAYFKVPRYIEFVDALPRSASKNEIERHLLRARPLGDCWDARTAIPPA